jgi:putative ABC transport system permease protein
VTPLDRLAGHLPVAVLARRNVSRATARSALAVSAVVIGVVAVGGVGLGGEAFTQNQLRAYEGFGGVATVSPLGDPADPESRQFTDQELDRLERAAPGAQVTPVVQARGATVRTPAGEVLVTAQAKAMADPAQFYDVRAGEFPSPSARAVVVGSRVAGENDIAVGDRVTVTVEGTPRSFRVAGVLAAQGFSDPLSADRSVFLPAGQFDDPDYTEAIVRVDPQEQSLDRTTAAIETAFNDRGDRRVFVSQVSQQREQFEALFERINQFLIGLGAVSLLVAAVTITNTMLMSIAEREGELGVLRAVGYGRLAVVRLVVAEAAILGLFGVIVGVPLTLVLGAAANVALLGDPLSFTGAGLGYVGLGAVLGVAVALFGGLYPAWRAANRRPVEALD